MEKGVYINRKICIIIPRRDVGVILSVVVFFIYSAEVPAKKGSIVLQNTWTSQPPVPLRPA